MVDLHRIAHKYDHLPEGLNELMTDISREVIRAQPEDIHNFIARYLAALLEARKALTIAGDVCEHIRVSCSRVGEEKKVNGREDDCLVERKRTFKEDKEINARANSSVDEWKRPFKEQKEENAKDDDATTETNESQNTINVGQPTQDEHQDRPGSSWVETEEYYKYRQHRDFWSLSVFSLTGSYMNLPKWKPYSAYDSITAASKPSASRRDHSGNSEYIVDRMCDE